MPDLQLPARSARISYVPIVLLVEQFLRITLLPIKGALGPGQEAFEPGTFVAGKGASDPQRLAGGTGRRSFDFVPTATLRRWRLYVRSVLRGLSHRVL